LVDHFKAFFGWRPHFQLKLWPLPLLHAFLYLGLFIFAALFTYGTNRYRDDFIEAGDDFNAKIKNSATFQIILNALRTGSPLLIWSYLTTAQELGSNRVFNLFIVTQITLSILIILWKYRGISVSQTVRNLLSQQE